MRYGAHGGGEGRGHIVSPRAQFVIAYLSLLQFFSAYLLSAPLYVVRRRRYASRECTLLLVVILFIFSFDYAR